MKFDLSTKDVTWKHVIWFGFHFIWSDLILWLEQITTFSNLGQGIMITLSVFYCNRVKPLIYVIVPSPIFAEIRHMYIVDISYIDQSRELLSFGWHRDLIWFVIYPPLLPSEMQTFKNDNKCAKITIKSCMSNSHTFKQWLTLSHMLSSFNLYTSSQRHVPLVNCLESSWSFSRTSGLTLTHKVCDTVHFLERATWQFVTSYHQIKQPGISPLDYTVCSFICKSCVFRMSMNWSSIWYGMEQGNIDSA